MMAVLLRMVAALLFVMGFTLLVVTAFALAVNAGRRNPVLKRAVVFELAASLLALLLSFLAGFSAFDFMVVLSAAGGGFCAIVLYFISIAFYKGRVKWS